MRNRSHSSLESVAPHANHGNSANNEEGWGGREKAQKATSRKTKKVPRAPKANISYSLKFKSPAAARLNSLKTVVRVKKVKQGAKEFELVTVIAEDNAENNEKYAKEGFEKKAGMSRELRGGMKSMAVWTLLKPIVGKANMNNLAAMFSGVGLGKPKSPSPVRVANVGMAVQEQVDAAMAELAGMFSGKARL
jgi:hypothetical protein